MNLRMKLTFKHLGEKWKRRFQQKNVVVQAHSSPVRNFVSVLLCHSLTHQLHIKATGQVFPYHFCGCQLPKNICWWRLEFISFSSSTVFSLTGHYLLVSVFLALSRNHFRPWEIPLRNRKKNGNYHLVKLILARLCHFRISSVRYFIRPWMQWNKLNTVTLAMQRHEGSASFLPLTMKGAPGWACCWPARALIHWQWFSTCSCPERHRNANPMARRGVMDKVDTGFPHFSWNEISQPLQNVCQQFWTGPWHHCKNKPLEIQKILWCTQHSLCFSALK